MSVNPTAVDISALSVFAGNYQQALFTTFYNNFDAISDFTFWPGVKNTEKMTKLSINGTAKPFTGVFAPGAGDLQYTGLDLNVFPWQRDMQLKPSDYRQTFMAANRGRGENPNNRNIPFEAFVWATFLKSLAAGINNRTVYFGVGTGAFSAYNDATIYHAGDLKSFVKANSEVGYYRCNATTTAGQSPLTTPAKWDDWSLEAISVGFGKIIDNLVTLGAAAGGLDPIVTGVINNASDAYQIQKDLWRSLPEAVQKEGGVIYQSMTDLNLLNDSFERDVSKYTEIDVTTGDMYLSGTYRKCKLVQCSSMAGSRRLIATQKPNMIVATDEVSDFNTIAIIPQIYHLDVGMSGVWGQQMKDPGRTRVSDQI